MIGLVNRDQGIALLLLGDGMVAVESFWWFLCLLSLRRWVFAGGMEAAAILLRLRARMQKIATTPTTSTPMMVAPATISSIAPWGRPV